MAVFAAGLNANVGKVDKEEICEGVYYFGGIWRRVVVLMELLVGPMALRWVGFADFFTPVDGGSDWIPVATIRCAICNRWEPGRHLEKGRAMQNSRGDSGHLAMPSVRPR